MRFQRLSLKNFKCYRDAELRLDRGVTVIHGLNGSGKSSLLEACFFALYGAAALDRDLAEVVTIGAEEAVVELGFSHDGGDYLLRRRVRTTGERARTAECVLEAPDATIEGARDVRGYVSDLLRMDADAFLNCAYVRQGEVNKLIDADAGERQDMIDDLLQLGKLEDYRERAVDARRGVQAVLGGQEDRIAELDSRIEAKEEKDLHERLNGLEGRLADLEETRERYEENRERARETLAEAEERIAAHEDQRERLRELEADVEDLEAAVRETEAERERVQEELRERRADREDAEERAADLLESTDLPEADPEAVADRVETLEGEAEEVRAEIEDRRVTVKEHTATAENERERATDLRERAASKRETAEEREAEAERLEDEAGEYREEADDLDERIEAEKEAFADAPIAFGDAEEYVERVETDLSEARERVTDRREALAPVRERIEEARGLLDEGKCPECGQPVEDSPHVDALDDLRREREDLEEKLETAREEREDLEEKLETARELATVEATVADLESERDLAAERAGDRETAAAEKREAAADLREEAEELDVEAEAATERAEAAAERVEAAREEIGSLNGRRGDLRERIETLEALGDALEAVSAAEADVERLAEKRDLLAERNDERRERLSDLREERRELREEYDEERVEEARTEKARAESYLEDVEAELAELEERRDRLVGAIDRTRGEIEDLEELRERRAELAERVEALRSLHGEASDLETTYGELRGELRRRNVDTLERMLNETFELVYENDSYTRIELDESYELTVYQRDGEPIQPDQLSGGERAVFNLSLRCAVYRLLAEGIEGSAPMPPLILDEPTVFLDSGHVSRLVDLVESMRSLGVEQILVVSHDEELVGAADDLVRVEKDPTSNRSTVRRERLASA